MPSPRGVVVRGLAAGHAVQADQQAALSSRDGGGGRCLDQVNAVGASVSGCVGA